MKSERNKAKNEEQWDKLLHIHTTGRDDSKADQFRYPYEPTPYSVLQRLARMRCFENQMLWIIKHRFLRLCRTSPQNKYHRTVLLI